MACSRLLSGRTFPPRGLFVGISAAILAWPFATRPVDPAEPAAPAAPADPAPAPAPAPAAPAAPADGGDLVPLDVKLPKPAFLGTPKQIPVGTTVKLSGMPRVMPKVPKGVQNVALNKKVTSSGKGPLFGTLDLITDGEKEAVYANLVEMPNGVQWVQVDLGAKYEIHAIVVWHNHMSAVVYHDVVIQIGADPDFIDEVQTVFNNDQDNSAGLGIGKDREYFETNEGLLVEVPKVKGRYVRFYSNGSTGGDNRNWYTEVEVFGMPAK
jgi:hypothetical protein